VEERERVFLRIGALAVFVFSSESDRVRAEWVKELRK